jgi:hypothetical protein
MTIDLFVKVVNSFIFCPDTFVIPTFTASSIPEGKLRVKGLDNYQNVVAEFQVIFHMDSFGKHICYTRRLTTSGGA